MIGTQSPGKYRQFIQSDLGHELDVKDLYHKYGKDSDYKKLQNKFLLVVVLIVHILLIVMIKIRKNTLLKIWLTARNDADDIFYGEDHTYEPVDMSGEPINPYNEDASEVYPEGTVVLSPSVTALGHITLKIIMMGQSHFTMYQVISKTIVGPKMATLNKKQLEF